MIKRTKKNVGGRFPSVCMLYIYIQPPRTMEQVWTTLSCWLWLAAVMTMISTKEEEEEEDKGNHKEH